MHSPKILKEKIGDINDAIERLNKERILADIRYFKAREGPGGEDIVRGTRKYYIRLCRIDAGVKFLKGLKQKTETELIKTQKYYQQNGMTEE